MFVRHIQILNYRCFRSVFLEASSSFNVIVGANNSGKSTLLRTLTALQFGASFDNADKRLIDQLGWFEITLDGPALPPIASGATPCALRLEANSSLVMRFGNSNLGIGNPPFFHSFPDNFACVFLSKRKVGGFNDALVTRAHSDQISPTIENLVPKLDLLLTEGNPLRERFLAICQEIFGMRIAVAPSGSGRSAGLLVNADRQIPISAMGDGIAQMLALVADLLRAENKVFIVEELENDLHPRAIRALLDLVIESCRLRANQFFVSTHSNVVLRHLAAESDAKIFRTSLQMGQDRIPDAEVHEVPNTPEARRELLEELGYDLFDAGLYKGYLLVEEASAESMIRDYLIPTFVPNLREKLRTIAAHGFADAEARFANFARLFTYLHLEPMYRDKAWIVVDAGANETAAISRLVSKFSGPGKWPMDAFRQWTKHDFEEFYPERFSDEVKRVLSLPNKQERRQAKDLLRAQVVEWLRANPDNAKAEFASSASEVIQLLRDIDTRLKSSRLE